MSIPATLALVLILGGTGAQTQPAPARERRERSVSLSKIDDIWCDYLAAIAELRGGIHWVSWAGKDPLHTFLTRAGEIAEEVTQRIDEEVVEAMQRDD